MRYLLFEYGESPISITNMPKIKYNYDLNLNILESNNEPAISVLDNTVTKTVTRVDSESPDSDDNYEMLMATQTHTLVKQEQSDSDDDIHSLQMSMITMTTTKVEMESTDQD